jgi:hypothetical protein
MTTLKLGPLPRTEKVRLTITLPKPLKEALDLYAAEHSRLYGPVDATALVPHMLKSFIRSDRVFMQRHGKAAVPRASTAPAAPLPRVATSAVPDREDAP